MRINLELNPDAAPDLDLSKCHKKCNLKPCLLTRVPKEDSLYDGVVMEGYPPETAIAWTKYGDGHIGFVGDSNGEEESIKALLAMCKIPVEDGDKVGIMPGEGFAIEFVAGQGWREVPIQRQEAQDASSGRTLTLTSEVRILSGDYA